MKNDGDCVDFENTYIVHDPASGMPSGPIFIVNLETASMIAENARLQCQAQALLAQGYWVRDLRIARRPRPERFDGAPLFHESNVEPLPPTWTQNIRRRVKLAWLSLSKRVRGVRA